MPDLPLRPQLSTLIQGTDTDSVGSGFMCIGRVDRRAASGAEGLGALFTALRRLDVDRRSSGSQNEVLRGRVRSDSIRRAGERLAICAVANTHSLRINFGFKGNQSTVAAAFDFHGYPHAHRRLVSADYTVSASLTRDRRLRDLHSALEPSVMTNQRARGGSRMCRASARWRAAQGSYFVRGGSHTCRASYSHPSN